MTGRVLRVRHDRAARSAAAASALSPADVVASATTSHRPSVGPIARDRPPVTPRPAPVAGQQQLAERKCVVLAYQLGDEIERLLRHEIKPALQAVRADVPDDATERTALQALVTSSA